MEIEDRITVIEPNGVRRSRPLSAQGLVIGRGSDADLVISYTGASRHHARVMFDGNSYYVIDLGSTNGTFLDETRLAPNVPELWRFGQILRIGDIQFQLERIGLTPQQAAASAGQGSANQPDHMQTHPDHMQTQVGWVPGGGVQATKDKGADRFKLILVFVIIFLCFLAALAAGVYFFLF